MGVELPKWPACIVTGESVSPELAEEILLRTDSFVLGGGSTNCREIEAEIRKILGYSGDDRFGSFEDMEYVANRFKALDLSYLQNSRIASSWIGGPHGWIDWDGSIGMQDKNIGKWPRVEDVEQDWKRIAEAFPELKLTCQLYDEEAGYGGVPLVQFDVAEGNVTTREEAIEPVKLNQRDGAWETRVVHSFMKPTHVREIGVYPEHLKMIVDRVLARLQ